MQATAKVFATGNSQAIRLPKAFRVQATEVWISKDAVSGAITLRPKHEDQRQKNLEELFRLIQENPFKEDFIPPRDNEIRPDPFADWQADDLSEPAKPTKVATAPKRGKRVTKAAA
jgi:antitoxin VapB